MKRFEELLRLFETRCVIYGACKPTAKEQLNSDLADVTAARLALVEYVRGLQSAKRRMSNPTPPLAVGATYTRRRKAGRIER
jgi:hypothetical protein